jgi:nitrate reductase beta subunit
MSKSDDIYNALDYARNKLKSATEAKGAAVASPYSLMDIAAAVQYRTESAASGI